MKSEFWNRRVKRRRYKGICRMVKNKRWSLRRLGGVKCNKWNERVESREDGKSTKG